MSCDNTLTVRDITARITDEKLMRLLDVKLVSLRRARTLNMMPASWFAIVDAECRSAGIECPRDLFSFKDSTSHEGAGAPP